MTNLIGALGNNVNLNATPPKPLNEEKKPEEHDRLLVKERESHPFTTSARIGMDKFQNAITVYPTKGLKGSRNSNFYEFLTMGIVPNIIGSVLMMAVFNGANKFFKPAAEHSASMLGKKMALGVVFYGLAKHFSKKFIETPIKLKYGIDMNLPYQKVVNELPDSVGDKDLISHEYHKAFESVDFPRWDLLYGEKYYGNNRNSYYDHVAKKMGLGTNLPDSDQLVKPKIKETVIKGRTFSTLSSYLWAALGVGIAMQQPWESLKLGGHAGFKNLRIKMAVGSTKDAIKGNLRNLGSMFVDSCKQFWKGGVTPTKASGIAAKALLIAAVGSTLIGNVFTLFNFDKLKTKKAAAAPIIDESKTKVVC